MHTRHPHVRAAACGALLALCLAGSAVAQDGPPAPREHIEAATLMPLQERHRQFRITEGANEGQRVRQSLTRTDDGEQWELLLEGYNRLYLERNPRGDLMLTRIDLIDQNKAVVYHPPVTMLPATVAAGTSLREQGRAVIYNLETNERTRTGSVTHQLERIAHSRFYTPAGEYTGYLAEVEHTIDTDLANVTVRMEVGYVPQEGIVARRLRYTVEKLGFFGSTTTRTAKLAEPLWGDGQR